MEGGVASGVAGTGTLSAIILDWGDTVMRAFAYPGPMAGWPEVAAVPGIADALAQLAPRYRLVLATNAADSGRSQVLAALRRAGLDGFFDDVVTPAEAGARKPSSAFYAAAVRAAGCAAEQALMVGDSYEADVAAASAAGLRAAWFNPCRQPCPEPHPAYDVELWHMAELPSALRAVRLPGRSQCLAWLEEQGASPELLAHGRLVAAVAFRLAEALRGTGVQVDPVLAHRGGLVHDLAKPSAPAAGRPHDEWAGELLRSRGHADLARIAERHAAWALVREANRPETWEEKLVCYADRVAAGSRLAPVEERLAAMISRRPQLADLAPRYLKAARALEAEIALALGMPSGELVGWLSRAASGA